MGRLKKVFITSSLVAVFMLILALSAQAAGTLEGLTRTIFGESTQTVDIIILLTILTILPSILVMMTSFTRIIIVLSFMRNALGTQQTPPNQVLIGLALFLTLFVMGPVLTEVYNTAYLPYTSGEITQDEFFAQAMVPTRRFLLRQVYNSDMEFFLNMNGSISGEIITFQPISENASIEEIEEALSVIPDKILIPAFLTSEIKRAFTIGFLIYIPFIVVDMVVASTLMSMGMMMLPPAMISLPFKILLFILVDGWQLVIGSLVQSFN